MIFDFHGDGNSFIHEKCRGTNEAEGEILAGFDGDRGWFCCNRNSVCVTVTVYISRVYAETKDARWRRWAAVCRNCDRRQRPASSF
ncbi:hypothetical protein [Maritimibacter alkaliphilus]|uniref:hypothetical protein n=1 Tax=Maritimibacter alkaliphilus TaxID=404236 RepID=UPI0011E77E9E|nr:hypothetical protein [Maritimibacter alkaliphilus]